MKTTTLLLVPLFARHAGLWAALGLLAAVTLASQPAPAAVSEAWVQRYNGPTNDRDFPTAIAVDSSGNVVVTGSSKGTDFKPDFYTAKYAAADGALLWGNRYEGPAYQEDLTPRSYVAVDGNGNVVVTGARSNFDPSYENDFYTAKFAAADGALLWEKRYDSGNHDEPSAIATDRNGNVVVTGGVWNGTNSDCYTAKYASLDGALLWEQRYDGPGGGNDYPTAVAVDSSGNVVVTGSVTIKYLPDGTGAWTNNAAGVLTVDGSGNVVVAGSSHNNGTNSDYYTAKYAAADGALLWERKHNGSVNGDDVATSVAVDRNGNVVMTGYSYTWTNSAYYTAKYAAVDGALLWERNYNGDQVASTVAVDSRDSRDNVVMTGTVDGGYYTAKHAAADGALLWEQRFTGGSATSLALGPDAMVAITGFSPTGIFHGNISGDYATVVYRENLPPISIASVPGGVRLRFNGVAGHSYQLLRAPSVTGPWSTNATLPAVTNGIMEYIDTNAPTGSAFYRTVQP